MDAEGPPCTPNQMQDPDLLGMERSQPSPGQSDREPPLVGAGLLNLGNTCFLNAVLQCVTHTVPLIEKLLTAEHSCLASGDDEFCSLCSLKRHVEHNIRRPECLFSPDEFANNLNKISSFLRLGQQEDAHEFLNSLLDRLHTTCTGLGPQAQPSSSEQDSLVQQVFGGRLISQLRCCDCGHCSDTFEPLLDISLEIDDVDSLTDALGSFTKVEKIEDFTCEGCKAQVQMEKQLKVDRAPIVITLHLKRFKNDGFFIDKIDKFIKYPLELNLRPYLSSLENDEQSNYDLYAIVMHHGSAGFGHYISAVRSSSVAWHKMDDNKVTRVSEACALHQEAYILFYVKRGLSPWFSSFMQSKGMLCRVVTRDGSPVSVLERSAPSPDSAEVEARKDHSETPCKADVGVEETTADLHAIQNTRQRTPDRLIDMFADLSSSENEDDIHLIPPQAGLGLKGTRELARPEIEANRNPHSAQFGRLMRGMPSSRRSGFLECLVSQKESHRRALTPKSEPVGNKRRRRPSDSPRRPKSELKVGHLRKLSPRSINRGLFINGSE